MHKLSKKILLKLDRLQLFLKVDQKGTITITTYQTTQAVATCFLPLDSKKKPQATVLKLARLYHQEESMILWMSLKKWSSVQKENFMRKSCHFLFVILLMMSISLRPRQKIDSCTTTSPTQPSQATSLHFKTICAHLKVSWFHTNITKITKSWS